jgi:hypothetical protein
MSELLEVRMEPRIKQKRLPAGVLATVLLTSSLASSAQVPGENPKAALVDALVWGTDQTIDANAYTLEVKTEVQRMLRRSEAYRSKRQRPANSSGLSTLVYGAQVRYERRLVATTDAPEAETLALAYVDRLRPCYEWEGYHDCPEREATFAVEYQAAHPNGPFSEYLPLLAAHRWLCTAEAYEYEKRPEDAARSRRAYEQAMSTARQSTTLLVRTAGEELTVRGRCFSPG